jgi:hypothetical protein
MVEGEGGASELEKATKSMSLASLLLLLLLLLLAK